jgi:hypothetical protein
VNFHPPNRVSIHETLIVNEMNRTLLPLLLATFALASCQTAHDAAVSTFRVIDAPHVYIRHQLGMDDEDQPIATTTTTTTTETNVPPNVVAPHQPFSPAEPPPPPEHPMVANESSRQPQPESHPSPAASPRIAETSNTRHESHTAAPKSSPTPRMGTSQQSDVPYAKPVPGKPGYVFSPFDKNGGYVDVTGLSPGSKAKDPYSGKIFRVP